jgi:hypothetical protein
VALRNPFGNKPTQSTQITGPLDQQLFTYIKPDQNKPETPSHNHQAEPKEKPLERTNADTSLGKTKNRLSFDINNEALYKASYVFTQSELEALEDLKLELRRERDNKISKNDLVRAAVHMLVEDYKESGDSSYLIRKIRKKLSK